MGVGSTYPSRRYICIDQSNTGGIRQKGEGREVNPECYLENEWGWTKSDWGNEWVHASIGIRTSERIDPHLWRNYVYYFPVWGYITTVKGSSYGVPPRSKGGASQAIRWRAFPSFQRILHPIWNFIQQKTQPYLGSEDYMLTSTSQPHKINTSCTSLGEAHWIHWKENPMHISSKWRYHRNCKK